MKITIVDINPDFINYVIADGLNAICDSIVEFDCDAVVSPGNSFGFMDGGVDHVYSMKFGWQVQADLRQMISRLPFGELLVGQAVIVNTTDPKIKAVVCAPTMRVPRRILDANDVRLATRAAVKAALDHGVEHLAIPGMGTGCGKVDLRIAARAIKVGIAEALHGVSTPDTWQDAQKKHFSLS